MADYKLLTMLIIMASINVVLFLFQSGMTEANPAAPVIFDLQGSPASTYITGANGTYSLTAQTSDFNIEDSDSVEEDTGNIFSDAFKTVKQWFNKQEERFGMMTSILKQPYGFMVAVGIPSPISAAFGFIWYGLAGLLIIGFIRGGSL